METRWLSATGNVLYYIAFPVLFLVRWLLYMVYLLLTPFIYLGYAVKELTAWPVRFLAQFEALWYFVGSAILLGAVLGTILHFCLRAFVVVFDLDRQPIPKSIPARGHDAASYRAAREEKTQKEWEEQQKLKTQAKLMASQPLLQEAVREARKMPVGQMSLSPLSPGPGSAARQTGLLQQTILEHTDEEDDDSIF